MGHEDREVSNQLDAVLVAVILEGKPLAEEQKLIKHLRFDLVAKLLASAGQRRGRAAYQCRLPLVPGNAAVGIFKRAKQSIVFEPGGVLLSKSLKGTAQNGIGSFLITVISFPQQIVLDRVSLSKV